MVVGVSWLFQEPYQAGGVSGDNGVGGDIFGYDGASADEGVFTDGDFGQNCGAGADRGAFFDQGSLDFPIGFGL